MTTPLDRKPESFAERAGLAFIRNAPRIAIDVAARVVARSQSAALEPGWHFDAGADNPSPLVRFRRDIWQYYKERHLGRYVTHRWIDGLRVRSFLGNDLSLCLYVGGSFEPNEFAFLRATLEPGMTVIDGGANEGLYSLFTAKRVVPAGTVIAVEPSARESERLAANLALNSLTNVRHRKLALGRERGTTTIAIAGTAHGGLNTVGAVVSNPAVDAIRHEVVELTTIDALVEAERLSRVDVIKLDIEGSEVDALEGAAVTIQRFSPLLLLEAEDVRLASQQRTKDDFRSVIYRYEYALWVFDSTTAQLRPAIAPEEPEGNVVAAPRGWTPPVLS